MKKGVPFRVEIGGKEMENNTVFVGRRDKEYKDRVSLPRTEFVKNIEKELQEFQERLFKKALEFQQQNTKTFDNQADFYDFFTKSEGGFALAHWSGDSAIEAKLKKELNVTIRCIPHTQNPEPGICIFSGAKSAQRVVFAKSY